MKISTVISKKNGASHLHLSEMDALVNSIRNCEYGYLLNDMRYILPLCCVADEVMQTKVERELNKVPKVCFSSEYKSVKGEPKIINDNHLVVLTLSNLPTPSEAQRIRSEAQHIPYTYIAYVGATGHDIVVVCKYDGKEADDALLKAYKSLHYIYSSQLGITFDNTEPSPLHAVYLSADKDVYYNEISMPFIVTENAAPEHTYTIEGESTIQKTLLPGVPRECNIENTYTYCYRKAIEKAQAVCSDPDRIATMTVPILAELCARSGVPEHVAVELTILKCAYEGMWEYVRNAFSSAYEESQALTNPVCAVNPFELNARRTEHFLRTNYDLRLNEITGNVEYRNHSVYDYQFRPVTKEVLNGMTLRAKKAGVGSVHQKQDISEYVYSDNVQIFNPITDYLNNLPKWDGKDHVAELTARIKTDCPHYEYYLHMHLLSAVAHWLGRDCNHGNGIVPLLIGQQGCGKTNFCNMLMPQEFSNYVNDKVDFRSDHDLNLALSSMAYIIIDEFDSLKKSQQPVIKYLVTKHDVKGRIPYDRAITIRRRYASFIGTTNNPRPLNDNTGSRRFVCIEITPGTSIDCTTPLDHKQLFAQLIHEVDSGMRYWFDDAENQEIMLHNMKYQSTFDASSIINQLFIPVYSADHLMSLDEIISDIRKHNPYITNSKSQKMSLGRTLTSLGYESRVHNGCSLYMMMKRQVD